MPGDGSLLGAVRSGDRRVSLVALRDRIASVIDAGVDPRELAALSLRLERILEELGSASERAGEESLEDALTARRRAKEAAQG